MAELLYTGIKDTMLVGTDEIIEELRRSNIVIVTDDEARENEGDFVLAAEHATTDKIAFIIRHSGGIVCLPMSNDLADHLDIPLMVQHNTSSRGTPFTVAIEATDVPGTGISAADRAHTIQTVVKTGTTSKNIARPGHVFPLRAHDNGVLARDGHTEAAVDFCKLAGLKSAAAISELMHDDGTMMRLPEILEFAAIHNIKVGTIADLIAYRRKVESDLAFLSE